MGSTRVLVLDIDDITSLFQFGNYALLMYYSSIVDEIKTEKMFNATITEYWFRDNNDLSTDGMDMNHKTAHFNISDLQDVVGFIDDQLIPALNAETQDLFVKYGGLENFLDLFNSQTNFLTRIETYESEYHYPNPKGLILDLNNFKEIFVRSIELNQAHRVFFR